MLLRRSFRLHTISIERHSRLADDFTIADMHIVAGTVSGDLSSIANSANV
jgi:hypothetical protein